MININTLNKTYITFNSIGELETILKVFNKFGFNYKNWDNDDALDKAESSVVNKIICHDNFVMTSKEKVTTISYKVFMGLSNSMTGNEALLNNNKKETMAINTGGARGAARAIDTAAKLADQKWIKARAEKAEEVNTVVVNFVATLEKAEEKAEKVCELLRALDSAFDANDFKEVERLETLVDSSMKFITKTNKILAGINTTRAAIVKAEADKEEEVTGKVFIGD